MAGGRRPRGARRGDEAPARPWAGARRQAPDHPSRRCAAALPRAAAHAAQRRGDHRLAGRPPADPVHAHRPAQDRPARGHRRDELGVRAAPRHPARGLERQGSDHRHLRALHARLGEGTRRDAARLREARDRESRGHRALPGRVLQPRQEREARREGGRADHGALQLRAAGRAGQGRAPARCERPPHRPPRRLALAVRLRPARERHPPRAPARRGRDPLPHRRGAARGLPDPLPGAGRDDRAHQDPRAHGRNGEAPPAGRAHQDAHARRRGDRAEALDAAHGPRREGGDAHLRSRGPDARLLRPGLHEGGKRDLAPPHPPVGRHPAGDRAHGLGQDHHALHDA